MTFFLESWSAIAPGLMTSDDWKHWFAEPSEPDVNIGKLSLKQIPPMLRRRFSELGKTAAASALPLLDESDRIPSVFASRHGDTGLTLSLLEGIARKEDMSPTGFSLAVHNAVGGVFSIARKDTSAVNAIAASEGLVVNALVECIGQLQDYDRVLCVIYDIPLPELYQTSVDGDPFPYACALILSRHSGVELQLSPVSDCEVSALHNKEINAGKNYTTDPINLIRFLSGHDSYFCSDANGCTWKLNHAGGF